LTRHLLMEFLGAEGEAYVASYTDQHSATALAPCNWLGPTDARLYRRTLAVLEFDVAVSAADIAHMLGVTRQSVSNWVAAYATSLDRSPWPTPTARATRPAGRGRPEPARRVAGRLAQDLGYPHATWTVPLLQEQIRLRTGLRPSDDTVRRRLHRLDYVWKRPRYSLDPDPEALGKKDAHPRAHKQLPPRSVLLAEDETTCCCSRRAVGVVASRPGHAGDPVRPERPAGWCSGP